MRLWLVLVCLVLSLSASADVVPPIFAWNRVSGTITAGGTSQPIPFKFGTGTKVRCVQNPSSQTENLYLDFNQPATPNLSFEIAPGAAPFCNGGSFVDPGVWQVNAGSTGHPYIAFEAQ